MNANLAISGYASVTAKSIMHGSFDGLLPDIWIDWSEPEPDIRDVEPDDEYIMHWHYRGERDLDGIMPDVNLTEIIVRPTLGLTAKVPRNRLVARGILSGSRVQQE